MTKNSSTAEPDSGLLYLYLYMTKPRLYSLQKRHGAPLGEPNGRNGFYRDESHPAKRQPRKLFSFDRGCDKAIST